VYSTDTMLLSFVNSSVLIVGKSGNFEALLKRLCVHILSFLKLR
jgi:hypothetical protein